VKADYGVNAKDEKQVEKLKKQVMKEFF